MSERRSSKICAVVERVDRHCGDDLVFPLRLTVGHGQRLLCVINYDGVLRCSPLTAFDVSISDVRSRPVLTAETARVRVSSRRPSHRDVDINTLDELKNVEDKNSGGFFL